MLPVPCFLTIRDVLDWPRAMIPHLRRLGMNPIICDHDSSYQPLLDWYAGGADGCEVHRFRNQGIHGVWMRKQHQSCMGWYVVTDCDLDLSRVPDDFLQRAIEEFYDHPEVSKVGLSLEIDDLPADCLFRETIDAYEVRYWQEQTARGNWISQIDTTLALYNTTRAWYGKQATQRSFYTAIRLDRPYTARHLPWYVLPHNLPADYEYYARNCMPAAHYSHQLRKLLEKNKPAPTQG